MDDSNLRKEAPELFSLEKKNVYRVEEGFFRELEESIHHRVTARKTMRLGRLEPWMKLTGVAAMLAIATLAGPKLLPGKLDMTDISGNITRSVPGYFPY